MTLSPKLKTRICNVALVLELPRPTALIQIFTFYHICSTNSDAVISRVYGRDFERRFSRLLMRKTSI